MSIWLRQANRFSGEQWLHDEAKKDEVKDMMWSKQKERVGPRLRCVWNILASSFI